MDKDTPKVEGEAGGEAGGEGQTPNTTPATPEGGEEQKTPAEGEGQANA